MSTTVVDRPLDEDTEVEIKVKKKDDKVKKAKKKAKRKSRKLKARMRRWYYKSRLALYKGGLKAKKASVKSGRAIKKASIKTGKAIKKGAKAAGRGALRVVGGLGWVLTGAVKVVFTAVKVVVYTVSLIVFAISMVIGALVAAVAWLLGWIIRGVVGGVNYLWDGSNWLVRGRPGSFKKYHRKHAVKRINAAERRADTVWEKIGLTDEEEAVTVTTTPEGEVTKIEIEADDIVRLRVFDEDHALVEEKYFPSEERAYTFLDERYTDAPVYPEVTPISEVIEEYSSEEFKALPEEEQMIKADEIAKAMLGLEMLGTEGENIEKLRQIIDEEMGVPTPVDVAATVYSSHEMPEGLAAPFDEDFVTSIENPREVDWTEFMLAREVEAAYQYFAHKARIAGNKREASYWDARLWMRRHQSHDMNSWRNPAAMFALYRNTVDKANTVLNQARRGIYDECTTLTEISQVIERHLDEEDIAEAERRAAKKTESTS